MLCVCMCIYIHVRRPAVDSECPGRLFCSFFLSETGSLIESTIKCIVRRLHDPSVSTPHRDVLTGRCVAIPSFYVGAET